jgi:hypothetical protein
LGAESEEEHRDDLPLSEMINSGKTKKKKKKKR